MIFSQCPWPNVVCTPAQSSCRNSPSRIPCLLTARCFHLCIFSCGSWGLCTCPEEEGPWTLLNGSFHNGCSTWALGLGSLFSRELGRSLGMSKEWLMEPQAAKQRDENGRWWGNTILDSGRKTTQGKQCQTREPLRIPGPSSSSVCFVLRVLQGDEPDGAEEGCAAGVGRAVCIQLGLSPQGCLPPSLGREHPKERRRASSWSLPDSSDTLSFSLPWYHGMFSSEKDSFRSL